MTASDPRVGEIQARLDGIVTPQPWQAKPYRSGFGGDPNRYPDFWDIGDNVIYEKEDAEFIAAAPADVAYLLAELADRDEKLAKVEALHRPIKKWEPYEGAGYTFATREEALRAGGEEDLGVVAIEAGPQYFEVCAECGRVESEQLVEIGEDWGYRESLWPCPTSAAVAAANGGGE